MTVALDGGDFPQFYEATRARYDSLLLERLRLTAPLGEVAAYALAGGKRVRPVFVEAVGAVIGVAPEAGADIAVAIEYLHTASILLDDLPCMDGSAERRGLPTAHLRFSQQEAILAAVALLSRSYEVLLEVPTGVPVRTEMVRLACETVAKAMASGQAQELRSVGFESAEAIRVIHARKTATLFQLGGRLAALCVGAPVPVTEAVDRFALQFGSAFQIADDLEDREMPEESRANLPLLIGTTRSLTMATALLDSAIESVAAIDTHGTLAALAGWLRRRMESMSI